MLLAPRFTTPPPASRPGFRSLQAGRAIAALLVVLSHNGAEVFGSTKYWPANPLPHFDLGYVGVDYFFVLSGFIILYVHWQDLGRPAALGTYLYKRIIRVYPVYWIALGAVATAYFVMPRFGGDLERSPLLLASSFSLAAWRMHAYAMPQTILVVAWSMYHEILFYLLLAIAVASRWCGLGLMGLWLAGSVAMMFAPAESTLTSFYFAPVHLLFGLGMGAAWLVRKTVIRGPGILLAGGVLVMYLAVYHSGAALPSRDLPIGIGAVLALVGIAELERSARLRIPALLAFLGDASYSIYLLHQPVLILLAKLVRQLPGRTEVPIVFWYIAFPCAAIGIAVVFHLVVERPLLRVLRRTSRSPPIAPLNRLPA